MMRTRGQAKQDAAVAAAPAASSTELLAVEEGFDAKLLFTAETALEEDSVVAVVMD